MGAKMVREVASKTSDVAGDGTTTATVYGRSDLQRRPEGGRAGVNPVQMKQGIEKAVADITEKLRRMSIKIKDKRRWPTSPPIAANNDREIGELLANAMEKVGKDGVITVDEGKSMKTEVEWVEGMQFDRGYLSPYFVTNPSTMEACWKTPTCWSTRRRSRTSRTWSRCSKRWFNRASRC
jgi:chaperonin GroEL